MRMAPGRFGTTASSGRLAQADTPRAGKRADPFYLTAEWKAFRNLLIKERGWRCEDPKCGTPRGPWKQIYGDHIVEVIDGGAKLDRRNVMLRCSPCHGRKTHEEKARRAGWLDAASIPRGGGV